MTITNLEAPVLDQKIHGVITYAIKYNWVKNFIIYNNYTERRRSHKWASERSDYDSPPPGELLRLLLPCDLERPSVQQDGRPPLLKIPAQNDQNEPRYKKKSALNCSPCSKLSVQKREPRGSKI